MRRSLAPTLTALACGLALAGCHWSYTSTNSGGIGAGAGGGGFGSGAEDAGALVKALNSFTEELLSKVDSASDRKAGAADAQALVYSRKDELGQRIAAFKRGAQDAGSKARWLEAEVDNTDRVHRLQLKYADEAARDPVLKLRLEQLIADYDALFR
ncbi:MAG TPA: hypothetical protein VF297_11880 [Pyrinomonadaceae bacterium]